MVFRQRVWWKSNWSAVQMIFNEYYSSYFDNLGNLSRIKFQEHYFPFKWSVACENMSNFQFCRARHYWSLTRERFPLGLIDLNVFESDFFFFNQIFWKNMTLSYSGCSHLFQRNNRERLSFATWREDNSAFHD